MHNRLKVKSQQYQLFHHKLQIPQIPNGNTVSPGALWSEKKVRMMVGMEGNARQIGDLITIVITEQTSSQVRADTTTRREASISNSIGSLFGLQNKILQNIQILVVN